MLTAANQSKWSARGVAVLAFVAGLIAARAPFHDRVAAAGGRVFELRIYHDLPGKLPVMESRFRRTTSKLLAKHGLNVLGYWVTTDSSASENAFVFLLAHQSVEQAKSNWNALRADPEFQDIEKAELSEKTLEKADLLYLRPTDFSSLK